MISKIGGAPFLMSRFAARVYYITVTPLVSGLGNNMEIGFFYCTYYYCSALLNLVMGVNSNFLNSTSEPSACTAIWPLAAVQS